VISVALPAPPGSSSLTHRRSRRHGDLTGQLGREGGSETVFGAYPELLGLAWDAPVMWKPNADADMVDHIEVRTRHAPRNRLVDILMEGPAADRRAVAIFQQVMTRFPSSG
jgi:hypothetical protein